MRGTVLTGKPNFSDKLSRFCHRMKDPEWRRYGFTLLAGKMLGLLLVGLTMLAVARFLKYGSVFADDATTAPAAAAAPATAPVMPADLSDVTKNPTINPINTTWTLIAAFLVFGMQAGFTMLEAGFCRSRETVNVLVECVFDTCLCGFLFYTWGYAFMFGAGNGFIGWHDPNGTQSWFFLKGVTAFTNLRRNGRSGAGALGIPVRVRRLRFDDLLRHHDRSYRFHRRYSLFDLRVGLYLSNRGSLGMGTGRLPVPDGLRWALPPLVWDEFPRFRRFDGRSLDRRLDRHRGRHLPWA